MTYPTPDPTPEDTTAAGVESAMAGAARAAPAYGAISPTQRAQLLRAIADRLDDDADGLVEIAAIETRLSEPRLRGELTRTTFQLRLFGEVLDRGDFLEATIDPPRADWPPGPRPDLRRMLHPLGPVLVFAASNFPFAFSTAGGDTASALAAGCPVIVKAHPGHPRLSQATAEIVRRTLADCGAPPGTFTIIFGEAAGRLCLVDGRLTAAAFTGSLSAGRILFDLAMERAEPIPFYGELGSLNPVFVTKAAFADRRPAILDGFASSFTLGSGQFCTKPGVILVPSGTPVEQELAVLLDDRSGAPLLNERTRTGYRRGLTALTQRTDVRVLVSGDDDPAGAVGPSLLATAVRSLLDNPKELLGECFGPVALVVTYDDESQLLEVAQRLDGQLTASIHAEPTDVIVPELMACLTRRAGRVLWNDWPTGVSVTWAMHHGGPYPATTAPLHTSVGTSAIARFLRPVTYQGFPESLLPPPLRNNNPLGLPRWTDGQRIAAAQPTSHVAASGPAEAKL